MSAKSGPMPPWLAGTLVRLAQRHGDGELHHAILLSGRPGVGKQWLAETLARSLLCAGAAPEPCGACPACRLTEAGTHPDLRLLHTDEREKGEEGGSIVVNDIRELLSFMQLSPQMGGARVAVIIPAERMNRSAANSLLKFLEEPPSGVQLILTTGNPRRLPPTVRSRCAIVTLPPPSREVALEWLGRRVDADEREVDLALALSAGMPMAAERLLSSGGTGLFRTALKHLAAAASGSDPVVLAREWENAPQRLGRWVMLIVTDILRMRAGGLPATVEPERVAALSNSAGDDAVLHLVLERLAEHLRALEQPLNGRLAAEAILLDAVSAWKKRS